MIQRQLCHKNLTSVWLMVQEGLNPGIHCTIYRQVNRLASMSLRGLEGSKPIPESLAAWEPILGSSAYLMSLKKSLILCMVEGRCLMNMVSFRNFWKLVSC